MENINIKFGRRVRELRLRQEISQEELAFRCQLSKTLKVVDKFAIGLDVHPSYLFQWHDE